MLDLRNILKHLFWTIANIFLTSAYTVGQIQIKPIQILTYLLFQMVTLEMTFWLLTFRLYVKIKSMFYLFELFLLWNVLGRLYLFKLYLLATCFDFYLSHYHLRSFIMAHSPACCNRIIVTDVHSLLFVASFCSTCLKFCFQVVKCNSKF